jgi:tetratricopeptide (TPR) repeat protein
MKLLRRLFLIGFVLSVCTGYSFAGITEQPQPDTAAGEQLSPDQARQQFQQKINFCRQLMNQGNFEGASALLETIYAEQPTNSLVINMLMQCYESLQYYPKAEDMIKRQLALFPGNVNFQVTYAELLAKQGKKDEAAKVYDSVVTSIGSKNVVRIQGVLQSMIANDMDSIAFNTIDLLRKETGIKTLYAIQKGAILEKRKQYTAAAEEYYPLLKDSTFIGTSAEQRLADLLNFEESAPDAEKVLLKEKDLYTNLNALKILSNHYLTAHQYDRAYQFTVGLDSIEGFKGGAPLRYMRSCADLKLYAEAAKMGQYMIRNYHNSPLVFEAYFTYADMLRHLGSYDRAISVYDTVYNTSIQKRDQAEALYQIGSVFLNDLYRYDSALVYFDSVSRQFPKTIAQLKSSLGSGYSYLRMGKLKEAQGTFSNLLDLRLNDDIKEEVTYDLGLIAFFEKQTDTAQAIFKKLIVDYPRGFYVNDALQLLTMFDEAEGNQEALYDYSNALLFEQRRMFDSTIAKLNMITVGESTPLADVAFFKLAKIYLSQADSVKAIASIDSLKERFPDSYYLPYGLKLKADMLLTEKGNEAEARDIYRRLLEKYPEYPFTADVRKIMRRLDAPPGSA